MALIQTDCCGLKYDKYKLTCKNLADHDECASLEGFNVTVVWDQTGNTWKYTDADGCVSTLSCHHPDTNQWVYEALVTKLLSSVGHCVCVLEGQTTTGTSQMPGDLPGTACFCNQDGAHIEVEAV